MMLCVSSSREQDSCSLPKETLVFSSSLHVHHVRETQDFRGICSHINFWPNSVRWNCVLRTSCLPHHRQFNLTLNYLNCKVVLLQTPQCRLCKCYALDLKTQLIRGRPGGHVAILGEKEGNHSSDGRCQEPAVV